MFMRKTVEERLKDIQEKEAQIKAQRQRLQSRQRELDRKERTKRLIENGALAEKYLNCQQTNPKDFESILKQIVALEGVKEIIK